LKALYVWKSGRPAFLAPPEKISGARISAKQQSNYGIAWGRGVHHPFSPWMVKAD